MRTLVLLPVAYALSLAVCSDERAHCPSSNDPKVIYIEHSDRDPNVCLTIRFTCAEGTPFSNDCGCGCLLP
jgi:hypothetical protein